MMKITNNTNAKSNSGVMFNSVSDSCALREHFFMRRGLELSASFGLLMAFQGPGDFIFDVAVIDEDVLDLGGVSGGEAIEFLGDVPDGGDHEVVGEHGGNGDEEAGDGGDQRAGHTGGHGGQAGLIGFGDAGEGFHDAPDGAEQADEGAAGDGGGEDDHAFFQGHGLGGGGFFEDYFDGFEGIGGDFGGGGSAGSSGGDAFDFHGVVL